MTPITNSQLTDAQILAQMQKERPKLRFVLPAFVLKLKYHLWLLVLRETSILEVLIQHYDEIPRKTFSYRVTTLFKKSSLLRSLLFKLGKSLRRRIY